MSPFGWLVVIFCAYWGVVWIWIKGTDPLAGSLWGALWFIIKLPLMLCGGFVLFALLCGTRR